ncbi:site-specific integrase [Iodidimonas sp. SYSU 1G8]|uniref:site-specific integrase n=1 Tax=Iodidimonas sp. SYSU 1G8 TaxID=3133967 RepID=UPI0031FE5357
MKTHPPLTPLKTLSLADLEQLAATMPLEREGRRAHLIGALRRIAGVLGRPGEQIRVDAGFADSLRKVKHQTFGISVSRWRNILVELRFCCRAAGMPAGRSLTPMSPAWQALCALVPPEPRRRLVRLARYCSEAGIAPEAVNDQVAADHLDWLREGAFSKNPWHGYRLLARTWNDQGEQHPQWPSYRFTLEDRRRRVNLSWSDFPESLVNDLAAWEKQVSSGFDFDAEKPVPSEPLAPRTIATRKHQLLTLASAAARAGQPVETLTSLASLCDKAVYVAALKRLRTEHGKERSSWLANIAGALLPIARHHVRVGEDAYRLLKAVHKQVTPRGGGLNRKNQHRLAQFTNQHRLNALQALPASTFRRLRRAAPDRAGALAAQAALAIQLLLDAPMRLANLTGLHRERHLALQQDRKGQPVLRILLQADEVKNRQDLTLPVPADTARLIEEYLTVYHPLIAPAGSPWLFPGQPVSRHKAAARLSTQISRFLLEQLGVEMHVHLFRHLAAMRYLRLHPGAYGVVQILLGHKSIETTISAYACFEQEGSILQFQGSLKGGGR